MEWNGINFHLSPGDHHQNSEADGGPGEPGRWCRLAWEMEDKAYHAFPSGNKLWNVLLLMVFYTWYNTFFSITAPVTSIQATTGAFAVCLVTVWRSCLSLLLRHIWKGDPYADLSDPLSGAVFISSSLYTELKFSPQDMLKVRACWWRFQGWGIFTKPSLERQEAGASTWKQEIVGVYCDYWKILVLEWKVEVL